MVVATLAKKWAHDMASWRLYTKVLGAGHSEETIVFLPGFTGSHEVWSHDFQALSQCYRLVLLDMLGFGHSPKPAIDYTLDDHLGAIHRTLHSLGVGTAHLAGHSMGCLLALAYANRYPAEAGKIALFALPWYHSEQEARQIIGKSSLFNRWLALDTPLARIGCAVMCHLRPLLMAVAPALSPDVPAVVSRDALRHTWTSYSKTLNHVIFQLRADALLRDTRKPVLIVQGRQDTIAPIGNVISAVDRLPNVWLKTVDAGHRLIFTHSDTVACELVRFLQQPA